MSREAHGRFCESVGVRFPHATRLFVERLWRSIKYEEVYLKAYQAVAEARTGPPGICGEFQAWKREVCRLAAPSECLAAVAQERLVSNSASLLSF